MDLSLIFGMIALGVAVVIAWPAGLFGLCYCIVENDLRWRPLLPGLIAYGIAGVATLLAYLLEV